jgi:hypothetical protein
MNQFPFGYEPIALTTWGYLSSLLMLALFFKFNRFWTFRNFDLFLLILLAPGLLMVYYGAQGRMAAEPLTAAEAESQPGADETRRDPQRQPGSTPDVDEGDTTGHKTDTETAGTARAAAEPAARAGEETPPAGAPQSGTRLRGSWRLERTGYLALFGAGLVWLVRLLADPLLRRKPMLEPNLSIGGLVFLGLSLMIFLFANVLTSPPVTRDVQGARSAVKLVQGTGEEDQSQLRRHGPGVLLFLFPIMPTFVSERGTLQVDADRDEDEPLYEVAAKSLAIVGQVAICLGLIVIGSRLFGNFFNGVGMATIYLLLPYTAQSTGDVLHILPAALMVWAVVMVRRPAMAGAFVGLASGVAYYPLFLVPLWMSFYWLRGAWRFGIGFGVALCLVISSLFFTTASAAEFFEYLRSIFGFWLPYLEGLEGIWALGWEPWFRLPLMVAFVALCVSFTFWPVPKNLAALLALIGAAMVGVQFWHGFGGGLYMAWYLPFALAVVFRPNLDDRTALQLVKEISRRRSGQPAQSL